MGAPNHGDDAGDALETRDEAVMLEVRKDLGLEGLCLRSQLVAAGRTPLAGICVPTSLGPAARRPRIHSQQASGLRSCLTMYR